MITTHSATGLRLTPDGVEGLYWPIRRSEMLTLRDEMIRSYFPLANKAAAGGAAGGAELGILGFWYLSEVVATYQACALAERFSKSGPWFDFRDDTRFWKPVMEGRAPGPSPLLEALGRGFPGRSLGDVLAKPVRAVGKLLRGKGGGKGPEGPRLANPFAIPDLPRIPSCHPSRAFFRDHVVATKRSGILSMHAAAQQRQVRYLRHNYWFPPVAAPRKGALDPGLADQVPDLTAQAFRTAGLELPGTCEAHFRTWLDTGCGFAAAHLERLLGRPGRLPKRLWGGAGGLIWERLLRVAVHRMGGAVTGHSHALGNAYVHSPVGLLCTAFGCDEYMVYSSAQRKLHQAECPGEELLGTPPPSFPSLREMTGKAGHPRVVFGPVDKVRTILLIGPPYEGEMGIIYPLMSDPVLVDWQARLLARLRDWGYRVIYKEHPDDVIRVPEEYETMFGAVRETRLFEYVVAEADLVLFANQNTSTFNLTLASDKPMLFMDFGYDQWVDGALELLGRRCPVVEGRFDEQGRAHVDWERLRQAIEDAPSLAADTGFADAFLFS